MDRAERHLVVGREDRGGRLAQREQPAARLLPAAQQVVAVLLVAGGDGKAGLRHRPAVACPPALRHDLGGWPGDMGDAAVAERHKMGDGPGGGPLVVDLHMRQGGALDHLQRHDHRQVVRPFAAGAGPRRQRAGHQDHAVGVAVAQHVEIARLAVGIALGGAHQHGVARLAGCRLHALHDLQVERVADVAHDHQHRHRAAGAQVAGTDVGAVVEFAGGLADAAQRRLGDEAGIGQRARDGRRRHAEALGDVLDARTLAHVTRFMRAWPCRGRRRTSAG